MWNALLWVGNMKILLVQDTDWFKRGPHQQHHLMERLSLKGHQIRVIDYEILWKSQGARELYSRMEIFNNVCKIYDNASVTVIRPGVIKIPWLDYVSIVFSHNREINRQIKEFKPDVIIGFGILGTYMAMKAAKQNNIAFVYYLIDVLHTLIPFKPFQPVAQVIEKEILKNADVVIALNSKFKDYLLTMGANPSRTYVVTAGIDFGRFKAGIDGSEIRKQYGIQSDDSVLFFMGHMDSIRGLKEATSEFIRLIDGHPNLKFLIVGEGELYPELAEIREQYDMKNHIILTGKQPHERIPEFLAAADICLLPFNLNNVTKEIVPIKIYEYMASGKPVIATELPGVMKEFGEGHGVIYVDKPEDVIKKAIELVENGSIETEGRIARRFVEKYDWDDIVDTFEEILRGLTWK